jgi:Benzoyl-CoA reductase/2-hydroxyglutaryl-CoA dehydratase subunit, BcrC/BadD/HgdB
VAIEELIRIGETIYNKYIDDWKKEGKRVIGYTCSYAPEEIMQAAGLLPIRLKPLVPAKPVRQTCICRNSTAPFQGICWIRACLMPLILLMGLSLLTHATS